MSGNRAHSQAVHPTLPFESFCDELGKRRADLHIIQEILGGAAAFPPRPVIPPCIPLAEPVSGTVVDTMELRFSEVI